MKVILKSVVPKIGKVGDIKDVSDGYARNFLIARGLATIATPQIIKSHAKTEQSEMEMRKKHESISAGRITSLKGARIEMQAKANKQGHLFAAIHDTDILKMIRTQQKVEIPDGAITIKEAIKEIGEHAVMVSGGGVETTFTLVVKAT